MKEERSLLKEWDHILEFSKNKYKYDLVLTEILKENDYQKVKSYKKISYNEPLIRFIICFCFHSGKIYSDKKNYIYKQKFYFIAKKMLS